MKLVAYTELKPTKGINYSREHIRRRERDGTFPLHVCLGAGRIGWIEDEVDAWLAERAEQRNTEATA